MNTIGQISEINFEIGEIFISEWTLSLRHKTFDLLTMRPCPNKIVLYLRH